MNCTNCPRNCQVDRITRIGFCGATKDMVVNTYQVFNFEEPCISGTKGSGAIFFSGCSLKCVYCQNYEISHEIVGEKISPNELVEIMKELENKGVHNINFITGTHYIDEIIQSLKIYRPKIPIVWNTHGYETVDNVKKLSDYVDIFLTDFKYFKDSTAKNYSNCPSYVDVAKLALEQMVLSKSLRFDQDGIMQQGVIVRHLILPQHLDESKEILNYLNQYKDKILVSLMTQFTPFGECEKFQEINRKLTFREAKIINNYFVDMGFEGYCQKMSSSSTKFIPKWNQ